MEKPMASKRLWSIVAAAIVLCSCLVLITVGLVAARGWVWPAFPGPSTVETPRAHGRWPGHRHGHFHSTGNPSAGPER